MPSDWLRNVEVLVFDAFGTTFDWWTGVTTQIEQISRREGLGLAAVEVTDQWRAEFFLALDRVRTGARDFAHLDLLHAEGLDRLLDGTDLRAEVKDELVRTWHRLPVWDDVREGLARLRERYTLAVLSNGGFAQTTNLVKNADLPVDCVLSAQLSRHYKPDPQVYLTAAELLDRQPRQLMMVAAHDWDLAGARAVGFRSAYVCRPLESGPHRPAADADTADCDLVVADFMALADALAAP